MVGHLYELAANDLYIKPQHPSISGISLDIEECAQLLEDGDYTLGIRTSSEAINIVSMTILKMDQDLNYREYDLNLCFTNSTRINLNHNYLSLLPFYSDYIENDIYYKIHYPAHNLVRARNQYALLKSMESNYPAMQKIINTLS